MRVPYRHHRHNVREKNCEQGQHHDPRVSSLRIVHLIGHSGGIVPAHVVPHRHQNAGKKVTFIHGARRGRQVTDERKHRDRYKRGEQQNPHHD